jgi:hypothetical protein
VLKFTLVTFLAGWAMVLAVALGVIGHDSRLGFGPLILFLAATMVGGSAAMEDEENRVPALLLAAAAFASCLAYGLLRYFMLFGLAGR